MTAHVSRRAVVRTTGAIVASVGLAGCISGGSEQEPPANTVLVGPDGTFVFDPDSLTVETGTTVTWEFESGSHNVYAYPDAHEKASVPDGAEPFGSVPKGDKFSTNAEGETFEHTFETTGTYTYVCVPHAGQGMVGEIVVE